MPYPEKVTYSEKYNLRPIIEPDGQFSAEDANHLKKKVNKNALFHDVHDNLAALQNKFPNPPVGAFAYLLDGSCYRCVNVGWKTSPKESLTSQQIKIVLGYTPADATVVESHETRLGEIEGLGLYADQANQKILIRNASGDLISELSVAFLNNEGTTFVYNETTKNLELKNDAGAVLSAIPVSAFVSNIANSISLNGSKLSLKDTEGNELNFVTFGISNIQGLQAALDGKAALNHSHLFKREYLKDPGSYINDSTFDVNTMIAGDSGIVVASALNTPSSTGTSGYWYIEVQNQFQSTSPSTDLIQKAYPFRTSGDIHFRVKDNNGVWKKWVKLFHSENLLNYLINTERTFKAKQNFESIEVPTATEDTQPVNKAQMEAYTPPLKVVTADEMQAIEDSTDITQDPTVYLIKNA